MVYSSSWETHLRATERHLPYGITCHPTQVNLPRHNPMAGTRFTYPGGMEGWVDLGVGYIPRCFTCPQTVTHPSSNHLIATRPGVEPTTSRSQVQRPDRYTTKPATVVFVVLSVRPRIFLYFQLHSGEKDGTRKISAVILSTAILRQFV